MRYPDDVPVLTEGTVTLRAHREDDLGGMYEQCIDPVSQRFTSVPVPYTRAEAQTFLDSRRTAWEKDQHWSFAIESEWGVGPSGFSGSIGLRHHAPGLAEIGFGAHPTARGHGVTTRAVKLLADWAFGEQGIRTIRWQAQVGNTASRRVAWKTGFTFEGASRSSLVQRGVLHDAWRATLLATDTREPKTRWLDTPTLDGDRVRLRPLRPDDVQRYLETNNDPETLVWLGTIPFPHDSERFHRHLARASTGPSEGASVEWAMAEVGRDEYVGTVTLFGMTGLDYKSAEVGYRTHPDSRGKGFLKEALRLAIGHAFTPGEDGGIGLERISLNAGADNEGSLRAARACGFTETGRDRQCYDLYDGSVVDLIRFDLLRSEYAG